MITSRARGKERVEGERGGVSGKKESEESCFAMDKNSLPFRLHSTLKPFFHSKYISIFFRPSVWFLGDFVREGETYMSPKNQAWNCGVRVTLAVRTIQ